VGVEYEWFLRRADAWFLPEISLLTGLAGARNTIYFEVPTFAKLDFLHLRYGSTYLGFGINLGSSFAMGSWDWPLLAPARACGCAPVGYREFRLTYEYCVNFTYQTSQWGLGLAYDF